MTLSRRALLHRLLAAGLSLPTVALLLDACSPRAALVDDPDAELGPIESTLNIYNWSDYVAAETLEGFEREFGVRISYDTYESNEEMIAKMVAGGDGYDLIVPTSYLWPALRDLGLIQRLKRRYLTGLGNIAREFAATANDPTGELAVPYAWGMTGIAYRSDKVQAPPDSWGVFHDTALRGRMTMMDEAREVFGAFLRYRGHSLNSTDPALLAAAKADTLLAKPNLKAFLSGTVKAQLVAGDVHLAQTWNGEALQARAEQERNGEGTIEFVLPKEGALIWLDGMAVPARARHPRAAHEFINYCLRPEVAAQNAAAHQYGVPNGAAQRLITHPVPWPSAEELTRLEYFKDLGREMLAWDRAWTEVKAAG
ncbi:MAG TPA: spermidine/putrescine ABC transporter substrate-binding protein [Gemmatimonadales bacterium]|nr:spermidine/putrescine ABC transporter substrate-binding protein [Gemmatimonadales bacterium]